MIAKKQEAIHFNIQLWRENLKKVVSSASTKEEEIALRCFERALAPLLEHPESLRTLLGKIKMST